MNGAQHHTSETGYRQDHPDMAAGRPDVFPGAAPGAPAVTGRKSPALATWLSLGPGLGQIYVGYYHQGFVNIAVVAGLITLLASGELRGLTPLLGVFLAFYWIYNMIDANRRAHHFNRVAAGLGGETVPDEFELPKSGGSLLWGGVLIAAGALILLDLNFGVSLEWIKDWWPAALILFGARLVYKARRDGR